MFRFKNNENRIKNKFYLKGRRCYKGSKRNLRLVTYCLHKNLLCEYKREI